MALREILTKRLLDRFKTALASANLVSSPALQATVPPNASKTNFHRKYLTSTDSADKGFFCRFLQRRPVYGHSGPTRLPEFLSLPVGEKLREKLKLKGINNVNLNLNSPAPAMVPEPSSSGVTSVYGGNGISVKDARKILKTWQVEKLKMKLRDIPYPSISYSHFFRICLQVGQNEEKGTELANILDDCGNVIVFGNVVFLRPEQVVKTLESLISESIAHPNDPRWKELEQMEKQKAMIDEKAKAQVRGELYCGLGYLTVQTLGFMRLTFWELSWDVMEPICFFVTSLHFALAYIFFLRTSTEPTFHGYFHSRFKAKQQRLMKTYNLNIQRYNELRRACYPSCHAAPKS